MLSIPDIREEMGGHFIMKMMKKTVGSAESSCCYMGDRLEESQIRENLVVTAVNKDGNPK